MVRTLRKLNLWVVFFTLIAYAAPYVSPQTMSFLIYVGLAYPWLLLLNVVFIFLWAASSMKYWWYSLVCVILGWSHLTAIIGLNISEEKLKNPFKIMTYNMGYTQIEGKKLKDLSSFIDNQDCDVLCLQEFCGSISDLNYQSQRVIALSKYPYKMWGTHSLNTIFSKYPIIRGDTLSFESQNLTNGCLYVDLQVNEKIVRIYNIHLQSNKVTGLTTELAEQTDYENEDAWLKIYTLLKRIRLAAQHRARQSEKIAAHLASSPYPVILCGDFNDIPVSYTYRTISQNLNDTYRESGFGFAKTYAGNIPALKIDFILTGKKIKSSNTEILNVPFSDHYPTVSYLGL
jgi:endonuclease/exonuclease/phosphatase family metal-dependent hydrolase